MEKALDKSKGNKGTGTTEMKKMGEIADNFDKIGSYYRRMKTKIRRISLFMQVVRPEALGVDLRKLGEARYKENVKNAMGLVEEHKKGKK